MTIRLDVTGRIAGSARGSAAPRQNASLAQPKGDGKNPDHGMAETPPVHRHGAARTSHFRRVQIGPARKACPMCSGAKTEGAPGPSGQIPPVGIWPKLHFALFVSMCVLGAAVIVDTGPFPLNIALGAASIILPLALVVRRSRSMEKSKHYGAMGRVP